MSVHFEFVRGVPDKLQDLLASVVDPDQAAAARHALQAQVCDLVDGNVQVLECAIDGGLGKLYLSSVGKLPAAGEGQRTQVGQVLAHRPERHVGNLSIFHSR